MKCRPHSRACRCAPDNAGDRAFIGQGQGRIELRGGPLDKFFGLGRADKESEVGVAVQLGKRERLGQEGYRSVNPFELAPSIDSEGGGFPEMKAMREAYQAVSCFHDVVEEVRAVRGTDFAMSPRERRAPMALDAEFKHRVQTATTTLTDMRSR